MSIWTYKSHQLNNQVVIEKSCDLFFGMIYRWWNMVISLWSWDVTKEHTVIVLKVFMVEEIKDPKVIRKCHGYLVKIFWWLSSEETKMWALKEKRQGKLLESVLFLQDNAPDCKAGKMMDVLKILQAWDHTSYSPEFAPSISYFYCIKVVFKQGNFLRW